MSLTKRRQPLRKRGAVPHVIVNDLATGETRMGHRYSLSNATSARVIRCQRWTSQIKETGMDRMNKRDRIRIDPVHTVNPVHIGQFRTPLPVDVLELEFTENVLF